MKDVPVETAGGPTTQPMPETAVADATGKGVVLVTGAAGLVGSHACHELARRGWTVRALVRSPTKAEPRLAGIPVQIVLGDLRSSDAVRASVRGVDAVVHLAAIAIEKRDESYEDVNAAATIGLLDAARTAGVHRFVHMSQNGSSSASPNRSCAARARRRMRWWRATSIGRCCV